MKNILKLTMALAIALVLAACSSSPIQQVEGKTAYTQVNMWVENGINFTTNYSRGTVIPVNTKVKIIDTNSEAIRFSVLDGGYDVRLINVKKYTKKNLDGIYHRYFGEAKVDLSKFSASTRKDIMSGKVKKGMSKDAVLLARGYPPAHRTLSLDSNVWKYWESRFNTIEVSFDNDKVVKIKN